jgi:predicted hydrocarbon binding protein
MKGIIFNLLEEVVRKEYGDETWEDLLETAQVDGAYTSLGNYPDEWMMRLVGAAANALNTPANEVTRWFGRKSLPLLAERYPQFFSGHKSARTFLLTLNDVIHTEVRKIYPGSEVPVFEYDSSSSEALLMGYRSRRKLCALAHGFTEAAAAHFGEDLLFEQLECMHRGDERCLFRITLKQVAPVIS